MPSAASGDLADPEVPQPAGGGSRVSEPPRPPTRNAAATPPDDGANFSGYVVALAHATTIASNALCLYARGAR